MNITHAPIGCLFVALLQLINYVVRFVTVTLTGIIEHQRQILHFPQHRERWCWIPLSALLGQRTGLKAWWLFLNCRERLQVVYKGDFMGSIHQGTVWRAAYISQFLDFPGFDELENKMLVFPLNMWPPCRTCVITLICETCGLQCVQLYVA